MKGKKLASWLLAGMMALGVVPASAVQPEAQLAASPTDTSRPADMLRARKMIAANVTGTAILATSGAPAGVTVLTRDSARREMLSLQSVLLLSRAERDAYDNWQNSVARAKDLDTEKFTFFNPWKNKDETILYSDDIQLQLRLQKYLQPDQMKLAYELASRSTTITIQQLESTMDSLLLSLLAGQQDVVAKARAKTLAEEALSRTKALVEAGRAVQLDADADALALKKAEAASLAAERTFENRCRSYNRFTGMPLERKLEVHLAADGILPLLGADDYVLQALEQRTEIYRLRGSLAISEKKLELLTFRNLHTSNEDIIRDYRDTKLQLERDRLSLSDSQRAITGEIRAAWLRLTASSFDVKSTRTAIAQQRTKLKMLAAQIEAGRLPAWSADSLKSAITGMEEGLALSLYALDGDVRRFRQATAMGPSLEAR